MAKENPLERVAREMAENCDMTQQELEESLTLLLHHLNERAAKAIDELADDDPHAISLAQQYWAFAELVGQFGTALIAYDDIDDDDESPDDLPN